MIEEHALGINLRLATLITTRKTINRARRTNFIINIVFRSPTHLYHVANHKDTIAGAPSKDDMLNNLCPNPSVSAYTKAANK